jgi:hypothetical protein
VIVVEVKGGGIHVNQGRWFSEDRHGQLHSIKNPYEQAVASKHALIKWLKEAGFPGVAIGHAVVFPHIDTLPLLGPAANSEITFVRNNLRDIETALNACAKHWSLRANLTEGDINELISYLAPTVRVRRSLSEASAAAESKLIELTAEQVLAFSGLRSNRGGLITGSAGTGKTVLAIARSQQLLKEGFRTLFVCYNEILGKELASAFPEDKDIEVGTFHSLCFRQAAKAGMRLPANPSAEWWEKGAAELLIDACAKSETNFDAVVVDEAQDFSPSWLEALRCLMSNRSDTPFYVFADPKQDIWKRNWSLNSDFDFCQELRRNLRNTHPIAGKVAACIGEQLRPPFGADGPPPRWRDVREERRPIPDVIAAVERLIDEGFGPRNLIVLCSSAKTVQALREYSIGPYSFGAWRSNGIAVETVARFKGMEYEAIVLVLEGGEDELDRTTAYVGTSRARSVLTVVAHQKKQNFLNWNSIN